jgi:hypothetical protein
MQYGLLPREEALKLQVGNKLKYAPPAKTSPASCHRSCASWVGVAATTAM